MKNTFNETKAKKSAERWERRQAKKAEASVKEALKKVLKSIRKVSKYGTKEYAYMFDWLESEKVQNVKEKLEALGYKVKMQIDNVDNSTLYISWT